MRSTPRVPFGAQFQMMLSWAFGTPRPVAEERKRTRKGVDNKGPFPDVYFQEWEGVLWGCFGDTKIIQLLSGWSQKSAQRPSGVVKTQGTATDVSAHAPPKGLLVRGWQNYAKAGQPSGTMQKRLT
jgi:hypothetical protein